jgi:gamma-glutamyl-gamma-aminobutyrate hydrolase PuuD
MSNIHIINGNPQYRKMFLDAGFAIVDLIENADIVCFTGGSDVSPHLYGERKHHTTINDLHRDSVEGQLFKLCVETNKKMVGICRGGQFLNVMNGGKMYQNVSNHGRNHLLIDHQTKREVLVTSTHHQQMLPSENGIIIASANEGGFKEYMEDIPNPARRFDGVVRVEDDVEDIEVVYYPHTYSLCFQPHPEFDYLPECTEYFFEVVARTLKD